MTIIDLIFADCLDCGASFTYNVPLSFNNESDISGINIEKKCTEFGSKNISPSEDQPF